MRSWEAGQDFLRAWESRGPNTALVSVEDAVKTGESMVRFRAGWKDSPISALKRLERLRSFFRFCAAMKWVEENPVGTLKPPKFHQKPTLPFTGEQPSSPIVVR